MKAGNEENLIKGEALKKSCLILQKTKLHGMRIACAFCLLLSVLLFAASIDLSCGKNNL